MSDEINVEVVEQLKNSEKLRGPIEKVVLSADGKLVDGHQRKAADPDWPEEINPKLRTEEDCLLFDIDKNWHRTSKSENWKRDRIEKLAKLGNNAKQISNKTGLPDYTVYRYFPSELKNQVKVEAGRVGGEVRASAYSVQAESQDLRESEEEARAVRVECDNCHLGHRFDELKPIDGKLYCPSCAPMIHVQKKNEEAKSKPVSPKSLDGPEEKLARMQPHDSQFQQDVFVELASEGLTFETNVKLPVVETEPDGLRRDVNLLVYLDCTAVHKGKRLDKDEQIRELFKKHHPEVTVLSIPYTGKSDKEKARVKQLIQEKYAFLKQEEAKFDVPTTGQGEA